MPCWYYDKNALRNTPSIQDGIDYKIECKYRKEGARFIIDIGKQMDLGYYTVATGVVYFHRFYMFHSFKSFPHYVTACCCLFLAGKVEETPKKCKDIINIAKTLISTEKFVSFGDNPKDEVMTLEKILLQTIKFDLKVRHPYSYLIKYAKCLKGDKHKLQKMVQMAWTFVNDSLCTTLFIQWEPQILAIASIYLAGKLSKFEVISWGGRKPYQLKWWDMFVKDLRLDVLEDICHQILDLYTTVSTHKPKTNDQQLPRPHQVQSSVEVVQSSSSIKSVHCSEFIESGETCITKPSTRDPRLVNASCTLNSKEKMNVSNMAGPVCSLSPMPQISNVISDSRALPTIHTKSVSDVNFNQIIIDNNKNNNSTIIDNCNYNNNALKIKSNQGNPFNNSININNPYFIKKDENPFTDHKRNISDNNKQENQFNKILRCNNSNFNYNQNNQKKNRFNHSRKTNWDLKDKPRQPIRRTYNHSYNSNFNFKKKFYLNKFRKELF